MRENRPALHVPRTRSRSQTHTCVRLLIVLTIAAGCSASPDTTKRGKLEGKLTVNGKPVASGVIRLMAIDPNGMNVLATVSDGQFSVPEEKGPTKGKYRVVFSVPSATKRRVPNDDIPGQFIEEAPETLPPRYNTKSEITIDYDPDQPHPHDFQLTTP